jgi:hypothetical protein
MVWYDIARVPLEAESGSDVFLCLRMAVLAGAEQTIVSRLLPQSRMGLAARTLRWRALTILTARRIIDLPDITAPVQTRRRTYVALAVGLGGLLDTRRRVITGLLGLVGTGRSALPSATCPPSGSAAAVRVPNEARAGGAETSQRDRVRP